MTREETNGAILLTGLVCLYLGYKIGWRAGQQDLLQGLERAQRIFHKLKEWQ